MKNITRYRIGVLEDDKLIGETLIDILETLGHQVVFLVDNGAELLKMANENEAELLLLDIQVKGNLDGVQTAERLKDITTIPYIFTTAFADDDTLIRVKKTAPFGYVVKPYGIKEIQAGIQIAMLNFQNREKPQEVILNFEPKVDHLFAKVNGRLQKIMFTELLYAEAQGDYVMLKTEKQGFLVHLTMRNLLSKLPAEIFLQVHRSFIVNLQHVESLEDNSLNLNQKHIPVSKSKMPDLLDKLNLL